MAIARPGKVDAKWLSDDELKQAVNLQLDEVEPFRKLFEQAAGPAQPVLHGKTAVAFFSRSGLPAATLKKIWEISDRNRKGHLSRSEFVLAARLVALAQVGMRATVEQLMSHKTRFPVPKFELPENIYTDDFDVTEAEKAIKHEYDADTCEWRRTLINVIIERAPFAEGAMRAAFHMRDLTASGEQSQFVAKMAKAGTTSAVQYFDDVRMQTEAKKWAKEFNKNKVPKRVDFIAAYVIELIDRPNRPICGVERFVPGEYVKYNNNWDWSDERRNTPQAFSHFTWEASGHTLLVCDIQGVADMYTDPQIHSIDGKGYGQGNLGMRGILTFIESHTCNHICNYLKLPAKRSKNTNQGTVAAAPHRGNCSFQGTVAAAPHGGTRVANTRVAEGDLPFNDKIKDIRQGLQDQFQERFKQMEMQAANIMKQKLEAQRRELMMQHQQQRLAIEQQRAILEAEKKRLEEEKAKWLEEERKKLGEQMDKRYELERERISREAMGELLVGVGKHKQNKPQHQEQEQEQPIQQQQQQQLQQQQLQLQQQQQIIAQLYAQGQRQERGQLAGQGRAGPQAHVHAQQQAQQVAARQDRNAAGEVTGVAVGRGAGARDVAHVVKKQVSGVPPRPKVNGAPKEGKADDVMHEWKRVQDKAQQWMGNGAGSNGQVAMGVGDNQVLARNLGESEGAMLDVIKSLCVNDDQVQVSDGKRNDMQELAPDSKHFAHWVKFQPAQTVWAGDIMQACAARQEAGGQAARGGDAAAQDTSMARDQRMGAPQLHDNDLINIAEVGQASNGGMGMPKNGMMTGANDLWSMIEMNETAKGELMKPTPNMKQQQQQQQQQQQAWQGGWAGRPAMEGYGGAAANGIRAKSASVGNIPLMSMQRGQVYGANAGRAPDIKANLQDGKVGAVPMIQSARKADDEDKSGADKADETDVGKLKGMLRERACMELDILRSK